MRLVAGVDSSTQSCKVVVREAESGRLVRRGAAAHPAGSEVDPEAWWTALRAALEDAGGLEGVAALSVGGQQHGMVCLDDDGRVVRPALLWNDTRSADAAADLVRELGDGDPAAGARAWAEAVGTVPVASITVTKLRWLADHEPENAARSRAVALPHDWLTWRLAGTGTPAGLTTDRSDASGTGYYDAAGERYRRDLLALALHRTEDEVAGLLLPRVAGPAEPVGSSVPEVGPEVLLGPGCGDNAGAALGLGLEPGEACLSIGTSGVVSAVATRRTADATGLVSGFADATGHHLPLACTLNGAPVLDAAARLLGVDHDGLSRLALAAEPGAGGLVQVPYLAGERTPNLPDATGSLHGMTSANATRENLARSTVEGLLCLLAGGLAALTDQGVAVQRITLVGGAARSEAVRRIAPAILGMPVDVPEPGESVADGAARQAAWALSGAAEPPAWRLQPSTRYEADPRPELLAHYREVAAASPPVPSGWRTARRGAPPTP